jgi:Xaa-Pro aminopeptidase
MSTSVGISRLERASEVLQSNGLDLLFVTPSADMRYLFGYAGHPSERPTVLSVPAAGRSRLLVPRLESFGVPAVDGVDVLAYDENEDGIALLRNALSEATATRCAVTDVAWASVLLRLQQAFDDSQFVPASPVLRELRMRKSENEIALVREAGARADAAFDELLRITFSGRSEREISSELADLLRTKGLDAGEWSPIVASGPNAASPHHQAGERVVREGDAVVLDFGGTVEGYYADITRTVHVGTPSDEFGRVYQIVLDAQQRGVEAARPGVAAETVDRATRGVIQNAGYGEYFVHRTGHGLGLEGHEEPYIVLGNSLELEAGMVFSVEPGVYLPEKFGVRIEDIVALSSHGAERMNNATRDLQLVR